MPECPSEAKSLLEVVENRRTTKTMPVEDNYEVNCTQMLPYEHRHDDSTHHDSSLRQFHRKRSLMMPVRAAETRPQYLTTKLLQEIMGTKTKRDFGHTTSHNVTHSRDSGARSNGPTRMEISDGSITTADTKVPCPIP